QHRADVGRHAGVVHDPVQLVDGVRAERVAYLRPVERDAHDGQVPRLGAAAVDAAVVREVGQVLEPGDGAPPLRVERRGDLLGQFGAGAHAAQPSWGRTTASVPCHGAARVFGRGQRADVEDVHRGAWGAVAWGCAPR